jgi:hypothetical protein
MDKLLTKLNLPLTKAEPAVTETKPTVTETKPTVTETKPTVTETKPAVTETKPVHKIYSDNPNYHLFVKIAKDMEMADVLKSPHSHYDKWVVASNKWPNLLNKSIRESIANYFKLTTNLNDNQERIYLMITLLSKNNLVFSDKVMAMYYDWVNSADTTMCKNRYLKMCKFIHDNYYVISKLK